jgi:hypothetical protein
MYVHELHILNIAQSLSGVSLLLDMRKSYGEIEYTCRHLMQRLTSLALGSAEHFV